MRAAPNLKELVMSNVQDKFRREVTKAAWIGKNMHKLVKDLLSEDYHSLAGTWSSSQFKDLLDDEEIFIKKYIKKEIPRVEREVFDTGTYLHTAVLEPHKISSEIAVYGGKIRRGKEWDKFKAKNAGKCVISSVQKDQGDLMVKAVKNSPTAQEYLEGDPEVSLFVELVIYRGRIYSEKFRKILGQTGWEDCYVGEDLKKGYRIIVKVRADCLGNNFVSDLKSTSANARSEDAVRGSISKYKYDLSAALYLDIFSLIRPQVREFVWIFASKSANNAQAWRATKNQILVGRAKYSKAMIKLADCAQANWELIDCLREAEPMPYEMEWLRARDTDLL